jgi:hypothetical protein
MPVRERFLVRLGESWHFRPRFSVARLGRDSQKCRRTYESLGSANDDHDVATIPLMRLVVVATTQNAGVHSFDADLIRSMRSGVQSWCERDDHN